jgi:AcrR family transcriptional regulator
MASPDTPERILDIAERLVQTRGFNGFSYADIAEAMQVTKASLHYHFRGKADLGKRLIERYEKNFLAALAGIDAATDDAREKLRRYAAIYGSVMNADRMCLCGMLAAEFGTLPRRCGWRCATSSTRTSAGSWACCRRASVRRSSRSRAPPSRWRSPSSGRWRAR